MRRGEEVGNKADLLLLLPPLYYGYECFWDLAQEFKGNGTGASMGVQDPFSASKT